MNAAKLIEKAKTSSFYLWLLNVSFDRMIPFNRPHGFRIIEIGTHHVRTKLPYKKRNLNHLKGLHACALATLTEITSGFIFATQLDPAKYRIILKRLEVDYTYQGKTNAFGEFRIVDEKGNQLTHGKATWQIKGWDKVKTKT